jgi:hypothetical protein
MIAACTECVCGAGESWIRGMGSLTALAGIARRLRPQAALRCSFCGKSAEEVARLVAGPSVYICEQCITTCVAVLEQHGGFPPAPSADRK